MNMNYTSFYEKGNNRQNYGNGRNVDKEIQVQLAQNSESIIRLEERVKNFQVSLDKLDVKTEKGFSQTQEHLEKLAEKLDNLKDVFTQETFNIKIFCVKLGVAFSIAMTIAVYVFELVYDKVFK